MDRIVEEIKTKRIFVLIFMTTPLYKNSTKKRKTELYITIQYMRKNGQNLEE